MIIYTVKPGDTLFSIGRRYEISPAKVARDNALRYPDSLVPGQTLVLMTGDVFYTVQPGDTITSIARAFEATPQAVIEANPGVNPERLQPGQVLRIRGGRRIKRTIDVNGYAFPQIKGTALRNTLPYLTYLSPFSHQVQEDGTLRPIDDMPLVRAARGERVAPLLTITNINEEGSFDSDLAHAIFTDLRAQETLFREVVAQLENKGYFGLNIDFEYIYRGDRELYNQFIQSATEALHPLGYLVTTAVAPKVSGTQPGLLYEGHDYAFHGATADYVIIMTYEWGYTYGPPQAVAPIDQVKRVLDYAVSVIPSRKILMGVPNYGYDWTLPYEQGTPARSLSNTAAVNLAVEHNAEIRFDEQSQSPFFYYTDEDGRQHVVWFEDARSTEARLRLVEEYDLAGVSYWNIGTFFPQNWLVLTSMYNVNKVL